MSLSITMLYAGLCGVVILGLALRVVMLRVREQVGIGHAENRKVERAVRAHANAIENVPLLLILLALLEFHKAPMWALHAAGVTLVLSRLLHGIGMNLRTLSPGRTFGAGLNFVLLSVLAVANIVFFFVR